MTKEEIVDAIKDIIRTIAPDEELEGLDPGERLRDQIELDSMDFLDIVMELRKRYGVHVPEEDYKELASLAGCATRYGRHTIIDRRVAKIDIVTEAEGFFGVKAQGYQHPAIISPERIVHILDAIEVETPQKNGSFIREPAIHPEIVEEAANAIVEALAQIGPDEKLGVKLIRKEAKLGIFHTKFLTSLLVHLQDDHIYVFLSRVNWPIPQKKEKGKLPEPRPDERPMKFRVVSGEHIFYAGPQAVEVDWQNPVFRTAYHLPGTSGGEKRRREVLFQSSVPKDELRESQDAQVSVDQLTPEQLRALADLEEDRREGRLTEASYQRAKRQLLRER